MGSPPREDGSSSHEATVRTVSLGRVNVGYGYGQPATSLPSHDRTANAVWLLRIAHIRHRTIGQRESDGQCHPADAKASSPNHHLRIPDDSRGRSRYQSTPAPGNPAARTDSTRGHDKHQNWVQGDMETIIRRLPSRRTKARVPKMVNHSDKKIN